MTFNWCSKIPRKSFYYKRKSFVALEIHFHSDHFPSPQQQKDDLTLTVVGNKTAVKMRSRRDHRMNFYPQLEIECHAEWIDEWDKSERQSNLRINNILRCPMQRKLKDFKGDLLQK